MPQACSINLSLDIPTRSLDFSCPTPARMPMRRVDMFDEDDWLCSGMDTSSSAGISSAGSYDSKGEYLARSPASRVNKNPFSTPSPYPKKREATTPESSGRKLRTRFQVNGVMRRERSGVVYAAAHRTDGEEYGIKVIPEASIVYNPVELEAMTSCTDLSAFLLYSNAWVENGNLTIQMEAAEQTLADACVPVDALQIAALADAVSELHARGYCLNNITAQSVVLVQGAYKLADFSSASPFTPEAAEADLVALAEMLPMEA